MRKPDSYRGGTGDCDFALAHELALAQKIMEVIGRFSQDELISPCPHCLRDTMLTVAALLHLEGATTGCSQREVPSHGKSAKDAFIRAGRARLEAVIEANVARACPSMH